MKILFTTRLLPEGFSALKDKYELIIPENDMFSRDELLKRITDCDALVSTFVFKIDKELIEAGAGRLRIIANYGVGYNNIDISAATSNGIVVTNTPDPVIEPTAEMAFALLLAAARKISLYDRKLRSKEGLKWGVLENLGQTIYGKTLGIVGMGRIGRAFARRALASGMNVIYSNRNRLSLDVEQQYHVQYYPLDELLRVSDVVSLHVPFTDETFHLINKQRLEIMKPTAILINTARGAVVDEVALADALNERKIFAAGLDVFENEPTILPNLLELDNVVLAPHNGTATVDTRNEMGQFVSQNIIRFFEGRNDITRVN